MVQVKFFKGCLPQILLAPFMNNLPHMDTSKASKLLEEPHKETNF